MFRDMGIPASFDEMRFATTDWLRQVVGDPRAIVVGHGIDLQVFKPLNFPAEPSRGPRVELGSAAPGGESAVGRTASPGPASSGESAVSQPTASDAPTGAGPSTVSRSIGTG